MVNLAPEVSIAGDPPAAFDVSATQTNRAGRMQGWLGLWGIPVSGGQSMSWMSAHSMDGMDTGGSGLMPGMASEDDLAVLRGLTGRDLDVRFLQLMIRHHEGGRDMAEYAAEHAGESAVRTLAGAIADTQTAETATMTELLSARGGSALSAP